MPVDVISIGLKLLEFSRRSDGLERVLMPIGSAIGEEINHIERLAHSDAEIPIDDELETIEDLLGVAFVVCQAHMNGILQRVVRLDRHIRNKTSLGIELMPAVTKSNKKPQLALLREQCPKMIGIFTHTEVLWSLANYYKHQDEFPMDWASATGGSAWTVAVISAAGLAQGSTGNLRAGAEALGINDYKNVQVLIDLLRAWGDGLYDEVRAQLGRT